MKTIKLSMLAMLGMLFLAAPLVHADEPEVAGIAEGRQKFMEKMEQKMQEVYKDLNLTDEQKKALDENKTKNRAQTKELFKQMKDKKDAIRDELQKETLDSAKIEQIHNELKQLSNQMLDNRFNGILEVRKILTQEQFKKFSSKMEEMKSKGGHRKWMGYEGGEGR